VAAGNDRVIVHGNRPKIGLLASQSAHSGFIKLMTPVDNFPINQVILIS
jgi:carbamate kinase